MLTQFVNLYLGSQRVANLKLVIIEKHLKSIHMYEEEGMSCKCLSITKVFNEARLRPVATFHLHVNTLVYNEA